MVRSSRSCRVQGTNEEPVTSGEDCLIGSILCFDLHDLSSPPNSSSLGAEKELMRRTGRWSGTGRVGVTRSESRDKDYSLGMRAKSRQRMSSTRSRIESSEMKMELEDSGMGLADEVRRGSVGRWSRRKQSGRRGRIWKARESKQSRQSGLLRP